LISKIAHVNYTSELRISAEIRRGVGLQCDAVCPAGAFNITAVHPALNCCNAVLRCGRIPDQIVVNKHSWYTMKLVRLALSLFILDWIPQFIIYCKTEYIEYKFERYLVC
jgi:hypothetical protein